MSEDTPWLSYDEHVVWVLLVGVLWAVPTAVDAQLKRDASLTYFEYSILVGLSSQPTRSMKMSLLAQWANGSQSRLSHAVSRMEKAGWVERRQCPGEPRGVEAVMTDAGWEKLVASAPGHVREVRRAVFDALAPDEQAALGNACRKILDASAPGGLQPINEAIRLAKQRAEADAVASERSRPGETVAQGGEDPGVSSDTLDGWVRLDDQRRGGAEDSSVQVQQAGSVEEENAELRRRIRELEEERDTLRKAARYLAAETRW